VVRLDKADEVHAQVGACFDIDIVVREIIYVLTTHFFKHDQII
jgi:hypothetical protein